MLQMLDDGAFGAAEIGLVPDVDRGDGELAFGDRGPARVVDVIARRLVEQPLGVGRGERLGLQVRAAERGAVDGVMDARVAPDRPQDAVLDIVEAERLAFDRDQLLAPGAEENSPGEMLRSLMLDTG